VMMAGLSWLTLAMLVSPAMGKPQIFSMQIGIPRMRTEADHRTLPRQLGEYACTSLDGPSCKLFTKDNNANSATLSEEISDVLVKTIKKTIKKSIKMLSKDSDTDTSDENNLDDDEDDDEDSLNYDEDTDLATSADRNAGSKSIDQDSEIDVEDEEDEENDGNLKGNVKGRAKTIKIDLANIDPDVIVNEILDGEINGARVQTIQILPNGRMKKLNPNQLREELEQFFSEEELEDTKYELGLEQIEKEIRKYQKTLLRDDDGEDEDEEEND